MTIQQRPRQAKSERLELGSHNFVPVMLKFIWNRTHLTPVSSNAIEFQQTINPALQPVQFNVKLGTMTDFVK